MDHPTPLQIPTALVSVSYISAPGDGEAGRVADVHTAKNRDSRPSNALCTEVASFCMMRGISALEEASG
jgi:hypothetical protein